jgi:hypothetical protein
MNRELLILRRGEEDIYMDRKMWANRLVIGWLAISEKRWGGKKT